MEQLLEKNPNPVISVGNDFTVLYSNKAGNLLLCEWGTRVGDKLLSSIRELVQKVISSNSSEKMEVKVGKRVYLLAFHSVPEEECVNIYGFEVSDQKRLEEELRENENKYRNIVETSVEGIWVFNSVSETTYVNEKMAEMLGYNPEEMIGRFIWDFAYEEDKGIFQVKLANRKQGIDEVYELKLLRKDSSPLWVSVSAKGFFDNAGKFAGSVCMFTDITERKKVEEALRESEERFRSAFYDSAVAMALVDPDARLMEVNDAFCRLLGFEKSEMEGSTFLNFTYPDDIEPSINTHKAVINRDKPFFWLEKRYIRKDGQVIWCEVSSSPVFNSKGCPIYTVAHIQDITERKKSEEALKKAYDTLEEKVKERTAELEKAYASLKESEKSLSEAQRMAHIGNWDWDLITGEVYWSDEMYRIFGRNPQEPLGTYTEFLNYIHPDDRDHVDNTNKKRLKGELINIDHRIILANGEERTVHSQAEIIFDKENRPIRLKGIVQDITERKRVEEKLRESEEKYRNIVETANEGIALLNCEGIITYLNKKMADMIGYSPEEMIGRSACDFVATEDVTIAKSQIENRRLGISESYEIKLNRKDGSPIWVAINAKSIFDDGGKYIGSLSMHTDITKRKVAEKKLIESEEKYRTIVETANEGIGIIDNELKLTYVNKKIEEMIGYSSEEIIGKKIWDFLGEESKPIVKSILEKGLQDIENPELKYINKDGSPLWAQVNAKPIFDSDGKLKGIMTMLSDITKRKETDEVLKNIEIARKKEIHHRIKNNLQVISSLLDLQADKFNKREDINYLEVLEAFRESQNRVISMALIHEELYKGGGFETLNFSPYIQELVDTLFQTYRLGNADISLNMDLEENLLFDMDTAVPLGMIVNELVSNSLKHAFIGRDRGEIRIKLRRDEEDKREGSKITSFTLTISDNGVGIPENLVIKNLDSLGMQLVISLVDQLDGKLELKRDNGTEFIIKFPVREE